MTNTTFTVRAELIDVDSVDGKELNAYKIIVSNGEEERSGIVHSEKNKEKTLITLSNQDKAKKYFDSKFD